jgi:DMSO reductase anchor subunit
MHTTAKKSVANLEEVQPRRSSTWAELPLLLFTLLGQMAVGGFWSMLLLFPQRWRLGQYDATIAWLLPILLMGVCLGAATLASFAHLGTRKNAWRVLINLRRSWLSREILFTGLFGMGWLFSVLELVIWHRNTIATLGVTATLGLGLVYSMAQVYRLPAIPAWNTWRTNIGFLISALLLGVSGMAPLLQYETEITGIQVPSSQWITIGSGIMILLFLQLIWMPKQVHHTTIHHIRRGLIISGMGLAAMSFLLSGPHDFYNMFLSFLIIAMEEGLGRWLFYRSRE